MLVVVQWADVSMDACLPHALLALIRLLVPMAGVRFAGALDKCECVVNTDGRHSSILFTPAHHSSPIRHP